jgi:hypothetical protein
VAVVIIGIAIINSTSCAQEHCRTYCVAGGSGRRQGEKGTWLEKKGLKIVEMAVKGSWVGMGAHSKRGGNLEQRTFTPTRPADWAMA